MVQTGKITYKIVGKVKAPIPEGYEVVGTVNNLVVDFADTRTVVRANSKIVAKKPRCINYGFNRKMNTEGACQCPPPNKVVCPKDRIIPAKILEE